MFMNEGTRSRSNFKALDAVDSDLWGALSTTCGSCCSHNFRPGQVVQERRATREFVHLNGMSLDTVPEDTVNVVFILRESERACDRETWKQELSDPKLEKNRVGHVHRVELKRDMRTRYHRTETRNS